MWHLVVLGEWRPLSGLVVVYKWWSGGLEAPAGQNTNILCDTARSLWMKFRENKSINSRALLWRNTLLLSDNSWSHNIRPMSHPTQSPTVTSSLTIRKDNPVFSMIWLKDSVFFWHPWRHQKGQKDDHQCWDFPPVTELDNESLWLSQPSPTRWKYSWTQN